MMKFVFMAICLLVGLSSYSKQVLLTELKTAKESERKIIPQNKKELISLIRQGTPLDRIDTSKITDMSGLFDVDIIRGNEFFKGIETWDTSNVTSMVEMFVNQEYFNQDISSWNVAKVKDMRGMFKSTHSFHQNLNAWAVSEDCNVEGMFRNSKLIPKINGYWSKDKKLSLQEILKLPQWYIRNSNDERIIRIFIRDFLLPKLEAKKSLNEVQQSILAKYLKTNKQSATQDLLLVSDFRIIQKINQFQKVPDFALYEQGFKLYRDYFITRYFSENNVNFINTYFEIPEVCDFRDEGINDFCAVRSDGENFIMLSLKKPLKLQGTLVFKWMAGYDGVRYESSHPFLLNTYLGEQPINVLDKSLFQLALPNEIQKGLAQYEIEVWLEVANKRSNMLKNFNGDTTNAQIAYGLNDYGDQILNVKNITFISQPKLKFYNRRDYSGSGYTHLALHTQDEYVNIRQSPNGKVISKVFTKDEDKILLISLIGGNDINKTQWIKVLYFPPNVNDAKKAILGYIHKSQISNY